MKKSLKVFCAAILTALVVSCATTGSGGGDPNVNKGIEAWNKRGPDAATAYWTDIEDPATQFYVIVIIDFLLSRVIIIIRK